MLRSSDDRTRSVSLSLLLASLATGIWLSLPPVIGPASESLGRVLLFLLPIAFGLLGTTVGILCTAFPVAYITHDLSLVAELVAVLLSLGCISRYADWIPSYIGTVLGWSLLIIPAHVYLHMCAGVESSISGQMLLSAFLKDVLFSLLAGAILMNSEAWFSLTRKTRETELSMLLAHVVTLTGVGISITVFAVLERLGIGRHILVSNGNFLPILLLSWSIILMTTLVGYRLAYLIAREYSPSPLSLSGPPLVVYQDSTRDEDYWSTWIAESPRFSSGASHPHAAPDDRGSNALLSPSTTGVCALDADGSFLYANDTFRAMTNIVLPGLTGKRLGDLQAASPILNRIQALFLSTSPHRELIDEIAVPSAQGGARHVEISLRPRLSEPDSISAEGSTPRVITLRDITARRRVNEGILTMQRLKSLDFFVEGASIRCADIFAAIVGRATHGLHVSTEEAMRRALQVISTLAHEGGTLSREMFELSSYESEPQAPRTCELRELLSERLVVWNELGGADHPVLLKLPQEELSACVDVASLTHAITELVNNARKSYGDRSGEIDISLAQESITEEVAFLQARIRAGTFARIRVADRGCGMSTETIQRCTDPALASREEPGARGAGLSTVFSIVRQHGGYMTVESRQEKGTTVCLYLPVADAQELTAAPHAQGEQMSTESSQFSGSSQISGSRVMIIQQRDELRATLSDMVTSLGFEHCAYSSCDEALRAPERSSTDLIIVDETLGEGALQQLIEAYKTGNGECRALMLTVSPHMSHSCVPLCDELLIKPFDMADLRTALDASLAPRPRQPETTCS